MHVGVITPRYPPNITGGGELSVKLLVDQLFIRDEISDITVYSFDKGFPTEVDGITVKRYYTPTNIMEISNVIAANRLLDEVKNIDLLHSYNMELHPVTGYLSAKTDTPSVATLNSYTFIPSRDIGVMSASKLKKIYKRFFLPTIGRFLTNQLNHVDRFFALSTAVKYIYSQKLIQKRKISVIPNMVDPKFEDQLPQQYSDDEDREDEVKILYVGSLVEEKGVKYLIQALSKLPAKYSLFIVGSGSQESSLRKLSENLGLSQRIYFYGHVDHDEIGKVYLESDIFVHPGIWPEPFGRTILEAMQAKLPVVCTDIGAPPEIVSGKDVVCEVADPHDLARAITRAYGQQDELSAENYETVQNRYQPNQIVSEIINQYNRVSRDVQ